MLESVAGFVEAGWRVVVTLAGTGPLVAELEGVGAEVTFTRTPVLRKSFLRPAGFVRLVADTAAGVVDGSRLLRRVRPDAVYVSTVTVPLWTVLGRIARRPVLVHVHEAESGAPALLRRLLALPVTIATRVVANSRFSVDVLRGSLTAAARRAVVVHNGVPGPAEIVPAREQIEGPLRLLYVGRLSARKGVDVALEAVGELHRTGDDVELFLLGAVFAGNEEFEEGLRRRAAELGVADRVTFLGFRPEVWNHLAGADVVVVPSVVDEPFGNTAVEGVLAARPVIVSGTSGLREAAAGYESAQRVPAGDAQAIADAVRRVRREWGVMRTAALADAATARERHAPALYRERIASILEATAAPR